MNSLEKTVIYAITLVIDIILILIIIYTNMNKFDTIYAVSVLITHAVFYIGLIHDNRLLLDICHVMLMVAMASSVFLKNKFMLYLVISLILLICATWYFFNNRCILNTQEQNNRYIIMELTGLRSVDILGIIMISLLVKLSRTAN